MRQKDLGIFITEDLLSEYDWASNLAGGALGAGAGALAGRGVGYIAYLKSLRELKQKLALCTTPLCKENIQSKIDDVNEKIKFLTVRGATLGGVAGIVAAPN